MTVGSLFAASTAGKSRESAQLDRIKTMIVDLALLSDEDNKCLTVLQRDEASVAWILAHEFWFDGPLDTVWRKCRNRPMTKQLACEAAKLLESELQEMWSKYLQALRLHKPEDYGVRFRVRACQYRVVSIREELEEL